MFGKVEVNATVCTFSWCLRIQQGNRNTALVVGGLLRKQML